MRRRAYEDELEALNRDILRMGSMVEDAVRASVEALAVQDLYQAQTVIDNDPVIDGLELGVEQRCVNLLALQQPMAKDLRLVATAISIVTDLERMGDHAVNISDEVSSCENACEVRAVLGHEAPDGAAGSGSIDCFHLDA